MKSMIFLHPSRGPGERHYLEDKGTVEDLAESGIVLREGLVLSFYDYDATENREDDKLVFEGTVHYDDDRQQWFAAIDWASFKHESDFDASP